MRFLNRFEPRLHTQIVIPLLVGAIVIGAVATTVAVTLLSDLTERWVEISAEGALDNFESRLERSMEELRRSAKLVAESSGIREALPSGDRGWITGELVSANMAVDADCIMLLDVEGRVLATSGGEIAPVLGSEPLGRGAREVVSLSPEYTAFVRLRGRDTLVALEKLRIEGVLYTLVLADVVDDAYLQALAVGIPASFCFYDQDYRVVACSAQEGVGRSEGGFHAVAGDPRSPISRAVRAAAPGEPGRSQVAFEGVEYRVVAREILLPFDPAKASRYVAAEVSMELTDQAATYTSRLIFMWSALAVCALVILGVWIARSVSMPLVELSDSAKRVAEGDFDTRVRATSAREVAELARSFNQMTGSLRQRTETLTKKVLELGALYEMSRSLGATLEMERLLSSVLDAVLRIFDVELGYVALRDPETDRLELKARRGAASGRGDERAIRSSMSEWVMREGRPLIFNPPPDGQAEHQVDSVTGALAALCVPLVASDHAVGAIAVGSHDTTVRFDADDVRLMSTVANQVSMAIGNIELFSNLQEAYLATVRSLAAAVDAKDSYTRGHSDTVAYYATAVAEKMGLTVEQRTALEMAAYLHDIGKIGVKEEILLKPGRLTDDEMAQMRHHPLIGANILKPVAFPWSIAPIVRHHHERWDGKGYPAGLKGEEIPLLARVLAVADAFEAMVSDRPYRQGRSVDEAIDEIRACAGEQFDPRVAEALVEVLQQDDVAAVVPEVAGEEEAQPDEVRAIFVAICDGMFESFRRLGGPRLAANLERELNANYRESSLPFVVSGGHMSAWFDDDLTLEEELEAMSSALAMFGRSMESVSGHGLVEHFYAEALGDLSERMRALATDLQLHPTG